MFDVELKVPGFGAHAVVALHGDLDLAGTPAVESHLIAAVAACGPSVIVDLAGLDFIDCSGLEVLVRARKWTRENGGDVLLVAPQPHVRRLLRLVDLVGDFSVYSGAEEAASGARLAQPGSAAATRRPMPSRVPAVASAQSWYAVRGPGKTAVGAYWLN